MILHFYTITYIYDKIQTNLDKYLFKIFKKLSEIFFLIFQKIQQIFPIL